MIDWLFRNRTTGRITIAQFPNVPLALFLAASILRWLLDPSGRLRAGLAVIATGALIWWAVEEVVSGVNPWRRLLGGGVLALEVVHLATRW
jgi:hypothetical protein